MAAVVATKSRFTNLNMIAHMIVVPKWQVHYIVASTLYLFCNLQSDLMEKLIVLLSGGGALKH